MFLGVYYIYYILALLALEVKLETDSFYIVFDRTLFVETGKKKKRKIKEESYEYRSFDKKMIS